jgi:tape measure domain-containing protein
MNTLEYMLKLSDGFSGPMKKARDEQGRFIAGSKEAGSVSSGAFLKVSAAVAGMVTVLATAAAAATGFAVKSAAAAEQTLIQFETLTGSMEQAQATLAELQAMGAQTPFELPQLAEAAKKLLAARVPTAALKDELMALGNVSAATGADIGNLATVYGQMAGQGKIYAEDMQQFVEAGAGEIKQSLAEALSVSTAGLNDLMSEGKVGFSDMQKALQQLAGEGGRWASSMEKQSKTTIGLWSTLKDNIGAVFREIGKPINDGPVKGYLTQLVSITGSASTLIAKAIEKGKVGEAFYHVMMIARIRAFNAIVEHFRNLPSLIMGSLEKLSSMVAAAIMGDLEMVRGIWQTITTGKPMDETPHVKALQNIIGTATEATKALQETTNWAEKLNATTDDDAKTANKAQSKAKTDKDSAEAGRKKIMGFSYAKSGANAGFGGLAEFDALQAAKEFGFKPGELGRFKAGSSWQKANGFDTGGKGKTAAAFSSGAFKNASDAVGQATGGSGMKKTYMGGGLGWLHSVNGTTGLKPAFTPNVPPPGTAKAQQQRREAAASAAKAASGAHPLAEAVMHMKAKLDTLAVAT